MPNIVNAVQLKLKTRKLYSISLPAWFILYSSIPKPTK